MIKNVSAGRARTKRIAVSNLSSPAAHEVDLVLWYGSHLWVPVSYEFCVFVHLVWLDLVVDN
jgi:hypothetical protein